MINLKSNELVLWAEAIAAVLTAPKLRIGNVDFADLRVVDVNSRIIEAAHEMGWQIIYNKAHIDDKRNLICFTEMSSILMGYFHEFITGEKVLNEPGIEPLFREASAVERVYYS